ncbi:MAG: IS91 family transposase [Gaiellales bacterium]
MALTLQEVFRRGFDEYARSRRLPGHVYRAARAIRDCRTAALGGHLRGCPAGHVSQVHYNSCRHRACPQCAHIRIERWLEARRAQLLPCDHYHVVFTIPHDLEPLWHRNRRRMTDLLFRAVRETLFELIEDAKYLGACPGVVATLHTWGRTLTFHPHIHCVVTGGGASAQGWKPVRNGFLLPVRVVRALFRGKLLAFLRDDLAREHLARAPETSRGHWENQLRRLGQKTWNVRIQERYAHATGVLLYLGRYLRGGPLANSRLLAVDDGRVTFRYRDHRDGKPKGMTLPLGAFLQRIVWHVPEPGRHLVRYWGVYARGQKRRREACRASLAELPAPVDRRPTRSLRAAASERRAEAHCPVCDRPLVVLAVWRPGRGPPDVR